jgi:hypothetical protein
MEALTICALAVSTVSMACSLIEVVLTIWRLRREKTSGRANSRLKISGVPVHLKLAGTAIMNNSIVFAFQQ